MTRPMKQLLAVGLLVMVLLLVAATPFAQFGQFGSVFVQHDLRVDGTSDLNGSLDVAGSLTVADNVAADNVTVATDLTVDDTFNIDDSAIAISGTQTITPTASVLLVSPSVASTITLATGSATAGDLLLVLNTVTTNTNIVDTGATAGGSSIDLGANDNALFIYLNSKWVEIASPDNS